MKKIISFSLWGNNPRYTDGAIQNIKLAKIYYPDWICRFYLGKTTDTNLINKIKSFDNTECILMNEDENWSGMFWRFYAADDESVDVMISRDCDSRIGKREKYAVEQWLNSSIKFHIMRDHPFHAIPILGGMWGAKKGILSGLKQQINIKRQGDFWQVDQNFLQSNVFPKNGI